MIRINSTHSFMLILVLLFQISYCNAQEKDSACKVLVKEISGTYRGSCLNGLADGKGLAKGEDTYRGHFRKGLPDGQGEYTYKNGNVFTGIWKNGVRNGKGKYKYLINGKPTVVTGYWKDGDYYGKINPDDQYRLIISGVEDYSIVKTSDTENLVEISFEKDLKKFIPDNLTISVTSGQYLEHPANIQVQDYVFPMTCTLQFLIPVFGRMKLCNFTFTISTPGKYEVLILNPL